MIWLCLVLYVSICLDGYRLGVGSREYVWKACPVGCKVCFLEINATLLTFTDLFGQNESFISVIDRA